jgi:hypothetical protein
MCWELFHHSFGLVTNFLVGGFFYASNGMYDWQDHLLSHASHLKLRQPMLQNIFDFITIYVLEPIFNHTFEVL